MFILVYCKIPTGEKGVWVLIYHFQVDQKYNFSFLPGMTDWMILLKFEL